MNSKEFLFSDWKFADPSVDYAFKRIFGTEKYKDATIRLLNSLIADRKIVDVSYPNTEIIGPTGSSRKSAIDVLCEDQDGAKFIVEMQNAEQSHFMERTVFYASKVISMLAEPGREYDYSIPPSYVIAFINFKLGRIEGCNVDEGQYFLHYVTREDSLKGKLPGSTEYFFLGIDDFDKNEDELETYPEKWLYLLKHSKSFSGIPVSYKADETFRTYFEACARAGFSKDEETRYTNAMMNEWDIANSKREACERAEAKGRAEGLAEGEAKGRTEGAAEKQSEIAKAMLQKNFPIDVIASVTGLSEKQVKDLQD